MAEEQNTEESAVPETTAPASNEQHTEGGAHTASAQSAQAHTEEANADTAATGAPERHKTFAIIGYILPFLFFLPLMSEESKHDKFARFHANQHLILLIAVIGVYVLHNILYMMFMFGGLGYLLMQLINIGWLVLVIIGIINAAKGLMKELPFIGGFTLID